MKTENHSNNQNVKLPEFIKRYPIPVFGSSEIANRTDLAEYLSPIQPPNSVVFQNTNLILTNENLTNYDIFQSDFYLPRDILTRGVLVVGQTGAGKTERLIKPLAVSTIANPKASLVIVDFKGNLHQELSCIAQHYRKKPNIRVLNLTNAKRTTHAWNPFGDVSDLATAYEDAHNFCVASENKNSEDSLFWQNSTENLITACLIILQKETGNACLADVMNFLDLPKSDLLNTLGRNKDVKYADFFRSFYQSESHNAQTVMATAKGYLRALLDNNLAATTSNNELNFDDLFFKPVIFILEVSQPDVEKIRPYLNLFFSQMFRSIARCAEKQPNSKLPIPLTILLDDFAAAIGHIPSMDQYLNVFRSRDVSIVAATQSLSQIRHYYGNDGGGESVISGFSTKIFISPIEMEDAVYASRQSGSCTVQNIQISQNGSSGMIDERVSSRTIIPMERKLFLPEEIKLSPKHPDFGRASTIFLPDVAPFQCWLVPAFLNGNINNLVSETKDSPRIENLRGNKQPLFYESKFISASENGNFDQSSNYSNLGISNTAGWTEEQIQKRYGEVKSKLEWENTTGSAHKWWVAFENENQHRKALILRLAEELLNRKATITEFFLAYVYSNTDNIQANLCYLDYTRLKKQEELKKKEQQEKEKSNNQFVGSEENKSEKKINSIDDDGEWDSDDDWDYDWEDEDENSAEKTGSDDSQATAPISLHTDEINEIVGNIEIFPNFIRKPRTFPFAEYQITHVRGTFVGERLVNEDFLSIDNYGNYATLLLSDGMGGPSCGHIASQITISAFKKKLENEENIPSNKIILEAVEYSNLSVFQAAKDNPELSGMGSTFVGMVIANKTATIFNVGNSRVYLIRDNQIQQLTKDHTLAQELIDSGSLNNHPFLNKPGTHMLTRSIGTTAEIEIDSFSQKLKQGDFYLICSDGVFDYVTDEKLLEIVQNFSIDVAIKEIFQAVRDSKGADNASLILFKVE